MALFLNKFSTDEDFDISNVFSERTVAKIDYTFVMCNPDIYEFHYVSFKAPKIFIKKLEVLFYDKKATSTSPSKEGSINVTIQTVDGDKKIKFLMNNSIADLNYEENSIQEHFVKDFINLAYCFNGNEDVIEVCNTLHPTEYADAITLSKKISSISGILNKLDKDNRGAKKILDWLKGAFLRFDILLKHTEESGEETMFSSLDSILSKHGVALFNR